MNNCDLILHFVEKYIAEKEKNILLQQELKQKNKCKATPMLRLIKSSN